MGALKDLTKWQNYVHYLMLTGFVFLIHWLSDITGVEQLAVTGGILGWFYLFMFYTIGIFIADTLIHVFFYKIPKPYRWRG